MSKSTSNDRSNSEWIDTLEYHSENLKKSDKINYFNSSIQMALTDLCAIECNDCGYYCKEEDLINRSGKHSKDEILCCPKCEQKDLKFH